MITSYQEAEVFMNEIEQPKVVTLAPKVVFHSVIDWDK